MFLKIALMHENNLISDNRHFFFHGIYHYVRIMENCTSHKYIYNPGITAQTAHLPSILLKNLFL